MELVSVLVAMCTALFGVVIWRVINWVWLRPKKLEKWLRQQGLKGKSYRLWFGDLKEISAMGNNTMSKPINFGDNVASHILPFLSQTIKDYGKDSFHWIGPTPRVNVMNPDHIKDVFMKIDSFQRPHNVNPIGKLLFYGLVSYDGEKWAKHRKIINPAFHMEKLKHMIPALNISCNEMLNKWESLVNHRGQGSYEVDVWPYLQNLSADMISRMAFGSSYEDGRRIFQIQNEQLELFDKLITQSIYIPGWRFMPTKLNKRVRENNKEIQALVKGIIQEREKAMAIGEAPSDDLLGILMESNLKEIKEHGNNKSVGMSIGEIIDECKLFYSAGQETTSELLVWTMVLLSRFPNWQARAREEVFKVFGDNDPHFDGLMHLKVVTMILYEVLRLYPQAVSIVRSVNNKTQLGNLSLPAGVQVSLPTILVHYDTELWGEDAKEFKPERFSEGVSKATKGRVSFFPFAWGPRICIGQNFAMIEAKMALASILRRFTFELSPSYTHSPFTIMTLQPQHGAQIILHKI